MSKAVSLIPRLVSATGARMRVLASLLRRTWIAMSRPGVVIASGTSVAAGVELRASDGGSIEIGPGCALSRGVCIVAQRGRVILGAGTFVGAWCTLTAKSGVTIGAHALIAERVSIRDQDHDVHGDLNVPIAESGFRTAPIKIGDGAWLGAGAVVLKGVAIGRGAVVAANAVVLRNVSDYEIVGGIPARRLGYRKGADA